MCPLLLYCLAMCSPDALRIVERILRLTGCTVTRKVEFGDVVEELEVLDVEVGVVLSETLEVINRPLAGDIIRDGNTFNNYAFQDRGKNIVRIGVAKPFWSKMVDR